ncbi:hypothetical protein J6590_060516 [Homalodisca vitripennis]|nr:hypothetical protein J6590_060516 [Homalodisca vitripennis]
MTSYRGRAPLRDLKARQGVRSAKYTDVTAATKPWKQKKRRRLRSTMGPGPGLFIAEIKGNKRRKEQPTAGLSFADNGLESYIAEVVFI